MSRTPPESRPENASSHDPAIRPDRARAKRNARIAFGVLLGLVLVKGLLMTWTAR